MTRTETCSDSNHCIHGMQ